MLSFKEKRAIQKEIKAKYEALESTKGFKAKRELQKAIKELYLKLEVKAEPIEEPKSDDNEAEIALKTILTTLEDPQATYDDFKALEDDIAIVENQEGELEDNEIYQQVIKELQRLIGDTTLDSIGSLFEDEVENEGIN